MNPHRLNCFYRYYRFSGQIDLKGKSLFFRTNFKLLFFQKCHCTKSDWIGLVVLEKMKMFKRLWQRQPNGTKNNDGKRARFDQKSYIQPLSQASWISIKNMYTFWYQRMQIKWVLTLNLFNWIDNCFFNHVLNLWWYKIKTVLTTYFSY